MEILILKLLLTPMLIGAVTVAGRRWGTGTSGWLAGLPLTSGPVAVFVAVEQGTSFASGAAAGALLGLVSVGIFCVVYGQVAIRWSWSVALLASTLGFLASTMVLNNIAVSLPPVPSFLVVISLLVLALTTLPENEDLDLQVATPWWDIPLRMCLATGLVLLLTGFGQVLGPHLTGLLAPLPIFIAILTVFAHRLQGQRAALRLLRGVIQGSFAFATFFLLIALSIERLGMIVTFAGATAAALLVQSRHVLGTRRSWMRIR